MIGAATDLSTILDAIGLLVLVVGNTVLAAVMTRFFRVRLNTSWGSFLYSLLFPPVVMVAVLLVVSGVFGLGPNLGSPVVVVLLTIVLPEAAGLTFDYFWMPSPDEVTVPETLE